jgi:hypothetical protein
VVSIPLSFRLVPPPRGGKAGSANGIYLIKAGRDSPWPPLPRKKHHETPLPQEFSHSFAISAGDDCTESRHNACQ